MPDNFNAIFKGICGILSFFLKKKNYILWQSIPGVIVSENKFRYLVSAEFSLESTCAFGLKHLGTDVYILYSLFSWHYILLVESVCRYSRGFTPG